MSGPLASVAAINAIGFGIYGNVSRRLDNPDVVKCAAIAGAASGFVQVTEFLFFFSGNLHSESWKLNLPFFLSFSQLGSAVPWKLSSEALPG